MKLDHRKVYICEAWVKTNSKYKPWLQRPCERAAKKGEAFCPAHAPARNEI